MDQLKEDEVKANPLLNYFLEEPFQEVTKNELNLLLKIDYSDFFSPTPICSLNLLEFLIITNHLERLHYLSRKLPHDTYQAMIKAKGYKAFRLAADHDHLEILNYLVEQTPNLSQLQAMMKQNRYYTFRTAADCGHLEILKYLVELATGLSQLESMMEESGFLVFCAAAEGGHLEILKYLAKLTPDLLPEMIQIGNYAAFRWAAKHGHLVVLNYLVELAPDLSRDMIYADCYSPFRLAAKNGHLAVLNYLVELAPDLLPKMIQATNYYAIKEAAAYNHYPIVDFLLKKDKTLYSQLSEAQKKSFNEARFNTSCAHHYLTECFKPINIPDVVTTILSQANYVMFFNPVNLSREQALTPNIPPHLYNSV